MCDTRMSSLSLSAPPPICMAQPGQSSTRRFAPDIDMLASFLRISSADISGNLAENDPPNPQQLSSSGE